MDHGIDEITKQKIIAVLSALFPDTEIYLFGSRARSTQSPRSDIDIALKQNQQISRYAIGEAVSMFEASNIPYRIEIVDFNSVSNDMQKSILQEGIIWKK